MPVLDAGLILGGRYTLHELIARGGMGEVWSTVDIVVAQPTGKCDMV